MNADEYEGAFPSAVRKQALEQALEIRQFEISLYWSRAAYFWAFIVVALAGFGAVQQLPAAIKTDFGVFVCCLGVLMSFAWYCANRGSKQWQENWENHVDLLEDPVVGPLYKTVVTRARGGFWKRFLFGALAPAPYSVSKINQIISAYITFAWLFLLGYTALGAVAPYEPTWWAVGFIAMTAAGLLLILLAGRTHDEAMRSVAKKRRYELVDAL